MIYLDSGATSFYKPPKVAQAVMKAMQTLTSVGRGGYGAAMGAAGVVYETREEAAKLFSVLPERVAFTFNCTHGLNIAIRSLVRPGDDVVVSGFEHNAVMRPLYSLNARIAVAGRKLFDPDDTLEEFEKAIKKHPKCAVFTAVSNVFGYILPYNEMARIARTEGVPFIIDAAQGAGVVPIDMKKLGADFICMPGHKALLGPQGTGIVLCGQIPEPLIYGGTGMESRSKTMPDDLPERIEAGTMNVPGIAGLGQGLAYLNRVGVQSVFDREHALMESCAKGLQALGYRVYKGQNQAGTVSFRTEGDCEEAAQYLAGQGIAVRAGLHCAPLAHESAGTLQTGTVRVSFGYENKDADVQALLGVLSTGKIRKV